MPRLTNLNKQQIKMLDIIWAMDSMDEVSKYFDTLPVPHRQELFTLVELLRLQDIDYHVDKCKDLSMAQNLLLPFMK